MNIEKHINTAPQTWPSARTEPLFAALAALPRPAWILFFGTFLNKFGTFVVPFLALYLTGKGFTVDQAGLAIAAYGVGNLLASILGGHLADHIGRRKTIVLSMFSGAAMMLLLSQARNFPAILLFTMLTGLTNEFYRPASSALLADVVPPERRITAFATLRMAFNAGFAFGPATAGFIAALGFVWLFVGDAATAALYGLVALLALPAGPQATSENAGWGPALSILRRDRKLHQLLLANFAIALLFCQLASTYGLYLTHRGFSTTTYGLVLSLNGVLVVLFELPLTTLTRKFPARRVMAVGYVLIALGFTLNARAHTIPGLVGCMLIFTFGEMITMPTFMAYLAGLAPAEMRGRYMGVSGLTWSSALIIGPALGMKLLTLNPNLYWIICASLGLFAAAIISGRERPTCENQNIP
ncbi:MAG TPA: MFS transporter [Verrucomicrobiae bacterium]|jgi:MFS family permease|nr:MFS transporter [Verrucomicrobiae bacterium]